LIVTKEQSSRRRDRKLLEALEVLTFVGGVILLNRRKT